MRYRRHHRHGAVGDVRAVPGAADADLDHSDVDRRVGEHGERHRGEHLEEGQRGRLALVHQGQVRQHLLVGVDEALGAERLAVHADPLPDRGQVRAGEQAGSQPAGAQQRLDHPGGGGLAVGPGDVDDRVGPLRVTEQAGQRRDPVQGRLDRMLGPPGDDLPLDLPQPGLVVGHGCSTWSTVTLAAYCRSPGHPDRAPNGAGGRPRPPAPGRQLGYFVKYQFSGRMLSVVLCGVTPFRLLTISVSW